MKETQEKYFQGGELTSDLLPSGEKRVPIRPLGLFSDRVVETFPEELVALQNGRIDPDMLRASYETEAIQLLHGTLPAVGTREYALGGLDTMMVYAGLAHSGVRVGEEFGKLIAYFSQDGLPTLDYERIIMAQPKTDPRTFTHGEAGSDEASFYLLHQDLERPMEPLVTAIRGYVAGGISRGEAEVNLSAMDILFANTRASGKGMTHFNVFRKYLNGIPKAMLASAVAERGEFGGPSGAYSPTVHELDLLVCGIETDYDEVATYVAKHLDYFPSESRENLQASVALAQQHRSLIDSVRASGYEIGLTEFTLALLSKLLQFRSAHLAAVARQVPQLFNDPEAAGTGGITASVAFLRQRLERVKALKHELEEQVRFQDISRNERRRI